MTLIDDYGNVHSNDILRKKVWAAMAKKAAVEMSTLSGAYGGTAPEKRKLRQIQEILRGTEQNARAPTAALVTTGLVDEASLDTVINTQVVANFDALALLFDETVDQP